MTIDELLKELMKIKEVYPNSGKWLVYYKDFEYGDSIESGKLTVDVKDKSVELE